jgi:hypothetical protein
MLLFPEKAVGFDTLMMIKGAFDPLRVQYQHRRQDERKNEQPKDSDLKYSLSCHCSPPSGVHNAEGRR